MTSGSDPPATGPPQDAGESFPAEPAGMGLHEKTISGVRSMSAARLVGEATAFASSVALARLVSPAEFGRTALPIFFGVLALAVAQLGTGSFLVSHKAPTRKHMEAASAASLAAGVIGTVLVLVFAATLAPVWFGERAAYFAALSRPSLGARRNHRGAVRQVAVGS